jgi:hypothetical protein
VVQLHYSTEVNMYCPSCGNEIAVELKYCNRCGANLSLPATSVTTTLAPVKLTVPSIVLGLTIICGLGVIFAGAVQFAQVGVSAVALVWIILFSMAALFGSTALMIRFWLRLLALQRETLISQPVRPMQLDRQAPPAQLPPRFEPGSSVTENTTRTFSSIYTEPSERGTR